MEKNMSGMLYNQYCQELRQNDNVMLPAPITRADKIVSIKDSNKNFLGIKVAYITLRLSISVQKSVAWF